MSMDIESVRYRLAQQAADMVNKRGMDPLLVADLLFEVATAVALDTVDRATVAKAFRDRAAAIENLDVPQHDA